MAATLAKLGQRGSARRKLFQPGEICSSTGPQRVHLLDLSQTGALAYADAPPPAGSIVRLACPASLGAARVVWVKGKRFGLAFAASITAAQLDAILAEQPTLANPGVLVIR